jgi:hypothetical protein
MLYHRAKSLILWRGGLLATDRTLESHGYAETNWSLLVEVTQAWSFRFGLRINFRDRL